MWLYNPLLKDIAQPGLNRLSHLKKKKKRVSKNLKCVVLWQFLTQTIGEIWEASVGRQYIKPHNWMRQKGDIGEVDEDKKLPQSVIAIEIL